VIGAAGAAHGSLRLKDGKVVDSPDADYAGSDSFDYTLSDGHGGSATGTVDLTVRNQRPLAAADDVLVPLNRIVVIDVLAADTDPNGDPLTVTGTSLPAHGTATFTADGLVTYTPDRGYLGDDTFTYDVSDGRGRMDTGTVSVSVANLPPVAVDDDAVAGGDAGSAITIEALTNDTDRNGDEVTIVDVSTPAHGAVTLSPSGDIVYDPADDYAGTDTFTYTIGDGREAFSVATITVGVRNRNPRPEPTASPPRAGCPPRSTSSATTPTRTAYSWAWRRSAPSATRAGPWS